jgi:hypothetical protein
MTKEHAKRIEEAMRLFESRNFGRVTRLVAQHASEVENTETFNTLAQWLSLGSVAASLESYHYIEIPTVE